MAKATLNKNGIATKAGDITAYNYDGDTREYLTSSVEFLAVGVGVPANSCTDAPGDEKEGFAVCRTADNSGWEYITDHRGEVVFDTQTGQRIDILELGDYPDGVTTLAPSSPYDKWNGSEWVHDEDAQQSAEVSAAEQEKTERLATAKGVISLWQTELQLGIISDKDKASLIAWMKYIQIVQDVDTTLAPDIKWPELPE